MPLVAISQPEKIHVTAVDVGGNCCAGMFLSTQVGHMREGSCHYEKETEARALSGCDVTPFGEFGLDGRVLLQKVGKGWDCAATHVRALPGGEKYDAYLLLSDQEGNYVDTLPQRGRVSLQLCPG